MKNTMTTDSGNPLQRLFAAPILLAGEDSGPMAVLEAALVYELKPVGALESMIVSKVAADFWRIRRVLDSERQAIVDRMASQENLKGLASIGIGLSDEALTDLGLDPSRPSGPVVEVTKTDGSRAIVALPDDSLGKHESRLQASALSMLKELRTLQAPRLLAALRKEEADSRADNAPLTAQQRDGRAT